MSGAVDWGLGLGGDANLEARRTGDRGEKMSANLGQIGRGLFAPVASPSGRWGDMVK